MHMEHLNISLKRRSIIQRAESKVDTQKADMTSKQSWG